MTHTCGISLLVNSWDPGVLGLGVLGLGVHQFQDTWQGKCQFITRCRSPTLTYMIIKDLDRRQGLKVHQWENRHCDVTLQRTGQDSS